jgi:hypothetical protein
MLVTTLDVETIPDGHWDPPADDPKAFQPIAHHVPVVIAWASANMNEPTGGYELHVYKRPAKVSPDAVCEAETAALTHLAEHLQASNHIVTWNGRGFDMPLLGLRALQHGVDWRFWHRLKHRFPNYKNPLAHYDVCDLLSDYGATGKHGPKLADVCRMLGFPGKHDIDGSQVAEVWPTDPERVATYCCEDVLHEFLIYLLYLETHGPAGNESWPSCQMARATRVGFLRWAAQQPVYQRWFKEAKGCQMARIATLPRAENDDLEECCRTTPIVKQLEGRWHISCPVCGQWCVGPTREEAAANWNAERDIPF